MDCSEDLNKLLAVRTKLEPVLRLVRKRVKSIESVLENYSSFIAPTACAPPEFSNPGGEELPPSHLFPCPSIVQMRMSVMATGRLLPPPVFARLESEKAASDDEDIDMIEQEIKSPVESAKDAAEELSAPSPMAVEEPAKASKSKFFKNLHFEDSDSD